MQTKTIEFLEGKLVELEGRFSIIEQELSLNNELAHLEDARASFEEQKKAILKTIDTLRFDEESGHIAPVLTKEYIADAFVSIWHPWGFSLDHHEPIINHIYDLASHLPGDKIKTADILVQNAFEQQRAKMLDLDYYIKEHNATEETLVVSIFEDIKSGVVTENTHASVLAYEMIQEQKAAALTEPCSYIVENVYLGKTHEPVGLHHDATFDEVVDCLKKEYGDGYIEKLADDVFKFIVPSRLPSYIQFGKYEEGKGVYLPKTSFEVLIELEKHEKILNSLYKEMEHFDNYQEIVATALEANKHMQELFEHINEIQRTAAANEYATKLLDAQSE